MVAKGLYGTYWMSRKSTRSCDKRLLANSSRGAKSSLSIIPFFSLVLDVWLLGIAIPQQNFNPRICRTETFSLVVIVWEESSFQFKTTFTFVRYTTTSWHALHDDGWYMTTVYLLKNDYLSFRNIVDVLSTYYGRNAVIDFFTRFHLKLTSEITILGSTGYRATR